MSSTQLYLAGLMVACGLVLGAFTLHGYFDPQWEVGQRAQTTVLATSDPSPAILPFRGRNQFIARDQPKAPPRPTSAAGAAPVETAHKKAAAKAPAVRRTPRKKVVDKAKQAPAPQQVSFQWPWNLLNN